MAETVISLAITKIGIALAREATRQAISQFAKYATQLTQLHGSMGRVMRELRVMHDSLCQMDIRNRGNQVYEGWLEEVRKVVHVIEDIVDEYLHLVGQERHVRWSSYMKNGYKKPKTRLSLNRIASMVKETEANLAHISQTKDRWVPMINNVDNTNSSYIVQRSQDLASISRSLGEDLVGIEDNKQKLSQWFVDDELVRSVIVLQGMGGLGKTVLAATIYKKEREKYDCHAWVSISQTYTREDVLRRLTFELFREKQNVPSNIATMEFQAIQEILYKFLEQKKYLIILDDVWKPEAFTDLFGALPNLMGSRIIITTRIADVAHLAFQDRTLTLEPLLENESWKLFCNKAFMNSECPAELETLSKQIVGKCEGLPLAIVSIGSLLFVRDKTREEWQRLHDQLSWELNNNPRLDHVRNVLYLSFIYLPTYLKSCFLYCSLFPEDYLLKRKHLSRLWVAEGFIEKRGESTLEEVAEGYIKELIQRNMLQLVQRNSFDRMKSFRMHDIVRELAVDLCHKYCFGVTYEEDKCGGSLEKDGRRFVVHKQKKDIHQFISSTYQLRSIITLDNSMPSSTLLPLIAETSRYMSVLELSGLPIEKVPNAIGDLFNLRHLGLRGSKVKLLPDSIKKLSNLLTLDLCDSSIHELPEGLVKLNKLRHLFAERVNDPYWRDLPCRSGVCIPKGLEKLTNLQTLEALEAHDESVTRLGELRQLRSLRVWNVKEIYCGRLCESLSEMRFLSYLSVNASDENEVLRLSVLLPNLQKLRLRGRLAEDMFEKSHFFQEAGQHLKSLRLDWSQLRGDPLPSLSRLSNLTDLDLTQAYVGEQLIFLAGWFPKLKSLDLIDLPNLDRLEIEQGAMVNLERLRLINLSSMVEVPTGIEFLVHLKYLLFGQIVPHFLELLHQCSRIGGMRWWYSLQD